jgi:predicted nucleotidyltransferase component of viral defense system
MLEKRIHKLHLTKILLKLYKDTEVASKLGFKGGTAAFLFYNLPRYSVDLDFDLLGSGDESSRQKLIDRISKILKKDYEIKEQYDKHYTLFWLLSYKKGSHTIKIEISKRPNKSRFDVKTFYGVKIPVMRLEDAITNKLMAVIGRRKMANRDLFDAYFFLNLPEAEKINYQLIETETGLKPKQFYQKMYKVINVNRQVSPLHGMGELLDDQQKRWVKDKLLDELKQLIKIQIDLFD